MSACPSVCVCLCVCLSTCLSVSLSDCPSIRPSDCLPRGLPVCLSVWPSACLSVRLCIIIVKRSINSVLFLKAPGRVLVAISTNRLTKPWRIHSTKTWAPFQGLMQFLITVKQRLMRLVTRCLEQTTRTAGLRWMPALPIILTIIMARRLSAPLAAPLVKVLAPLRMEICTSTNWSEVSRKIRCWAFADSLSNNYL